jgi:integrase
MLTYDVDVWSIRKRPGRPKPYELRWRVGKRPHSKSFRLKPQADGRRSELMTAVREGQQFDDATGLPARELAALSSPTWFGHAVAYALMKWPRAAAKQRASIAEALSVVVPALVSTRRGMPDARVMRAALYQWAFRAVVGPDGTLVSRHAVEDPPADIRRALDWIAEHSMKVNALENDPALLRPALESLGQRLDGTKAAENTERRKRMVLSNFLRFTVEEKGLLSTNPMTRVDWTPPQREDEIDFRYVPGPALVLKFLTAVRETGARGEHLEAFFGCLYYAAMRPGEIAALKRRQCTLPDLDKDPDAWGELLLEESRPEVGGGWTDDGASFETRGLKRRARRATRPVPIPPALVRMLREHIERFGTAPDGRLFWAAEGGRVRSTEYCAVWDAARTAVLSEDEAASPLAAVPYSLRHAGVSLWIRSGVDPAEVAARAGHSIAVLYRFYAKILKGDQARSNRLIAKGLSATE